jgi:hypothetical protein
MRLRFVIAALAAWSTAGLAPAAIAGAAPVTGQLARPVALDGLLLYSRLADGDVWDLYERTRAGEEVKLAVRPSRLAFDADLGTDSSGKVVAVYSRCEPICRIAMLDLASGVERLVAGVRATGHTETAPAIRDGVLAFQRRPARLDSGGEYRIITLGAGRRSRLLKRLRSDQNVTGADLSARGLAIATETTAGEGRTVSLQVKPTSRPWRTLQAVRSGALSRVELTPPAWRGNDLYWGFARRYDVPNRALVRARVTRAGTAYATATAPSPLDGRTTITGVALDAFSSEAPIWILVEQAREESPTYAMDAYPLADVPFGPARRDIGLQR